MTALGTLIQQYLDLHPAKNKKAVAEAAGISPQLLSGWINGTKRMKEYPDKDTVQGLADALGLEYLTVLDAITEDLGVAVQRAEIDRPEVAVHVAALSKLPPERLRAVGRLIADLMDET